MDPSVEQLWKVLLWGLGICSVGFFTLLGIVLRTTYSMTKPLNEIRDFLLGSFGNPHGMKHEFDDLKKKVSHMDERCQKNHG